MKIKMIISYDGTNYSGWQVQDNALTVQSTLEDALKMATGEGIIIKTTASGRTDAGVHAKEQVVSFESSSKIPPEKFCRAVNVYLPRDIRAIKSEMVEENFDARKSAKAKTYVYKTYIDKEDNPLLDRFAVRIDEDLDIKRVKKVAKNFVGTHDFKCFCASGSSVKNTIRTIYSIKVKKQKNSVEFFVRGNGFLYNMVRTLVGTILMLSTKDDKKAKEIVKGLLEDKKRELAGKTFPARGLTLYSVEY